MRAIVVMTMLALPGTAAAQTTAPTVLDNLAEGEQPTTVQADTALAVDAAVPLPAVAFGLTGSEAEATTASPALFGSGPVSEDELAATSGRQQIDWMQAVTRNSATVSGNKVGDYNRTGDVTVADSAFQNVTGISMVNMNTGNNSSMNAGMSVNLQINYAPTVP